MSLSKRARSTLKTFAAQRQDGLELAVAAPLGGSRRRSRPRRCRSAQRRVFSRQSASLPGRPTPSRRPCGVISRARRAASRAREASTILPQMVLASMGRSSRKSASFCRRLLRRPGGLRRRPACLGLAAELGVSILTDNARRPPSRMSSPEMSTLAFWRSRFLRCICR